MKDHDANQSFWEAFLATLPAESPYRGKNFQVDNFGDNPKMADELGALVRDGIKTGTCSALWEWEHEGEFPPEPGSPRIVLDGDNIPFCITETVEVTFRKYHEVDAEFARAEGEGDLSLEYWREAHRNFFSRVLPSIGKAFSEDMLLVCERFRMNYK